MVERLLAKEEVASSTLVFRSMSRKRPANGGPLSFSDRSHPAIGISPCTGAKRWGSGGLTAFVAQGLFQPPDLLLELRGQFGP